MKHFDKRQLIYTGQLSDLSCFANRVEFLSCLRDSTFDSDQQCSKETTRGKYLFHDRFLDSIIYIKVLQWIWCLFSLCKPGVGSKPAWDLAGLIPSSGLN